MSYLVRKTNGSVLVEVPDETVNTTSTSVALVGRGAVNYGQAFAENFVKLTENFANATAPSTPIIGQLWYDTTTRLLKVYSGSDWDLLSAAITPDGSLAGAVGTNITTTTGERAVTILFSANVVMAVICHHTIAFDALPTTISVADRTYDFKARFPSGLFPGINLASSSSNYALHGSSKWGPSRTITFGADVSGSVVIDGSANETVNITLDTTGVTPGTYSRVTVDSKGRVTAGANPSGIITFTGDVTGSGLDTIALTLGNTGVTARKYGTDATDYATDQGMKIPSFTVDAKGRITSATDTAVLSASTLRAGIVRLSNSINSTSEDLAATAKAVKEVADIAESALKSTGGTVSGNLTVTGNLIVSGNTTTINTTNINLEDPVILLGGTTAPTVDDNKDRGVAYRWHDGTAAKIGFFGWDDSTSQFTFIPDATGHSNATYAGTVGTIRANLNGNVTGNVTGNASTASTLQTSRQITLTGDASGSASFNGSANVSITVTLDNMVTAGTYRSVTVDAKGRVTAGSNPTTLAGYGITNAVDLVNDQKIKGRKTFEDTVTVETNIAAGTCTGSWIATEAEAKAGTINNKIMTPLRVAQVVDTAVPPGTVIHYAARTPPTGYLKANGAAVSRTTYSALFAAIGTTFGVGNGTSTFNLPDLRGEFIRGWDDGRGVDASRTFGNDQADQIRSHRHDLKSPSGNQYYVLNDLNTTPPAEDVAAGAFRADGPDNGGDARWYPYTSYTGGSETRPRNVALLACIKY